MHSIPRTCVLAGLFLSLTACGLGGMAASTATEAAAQAEQAKQGKALEAQIKRQVEAAQQAAKDQVDGVEAEAGSSP